MVELPTEADPVRVVHGMNVDVMKSLPSASFDAVITDPPYPCIKRSYGYWTEAEWFALMDVVVPECRRVLKPSGSAVFVLQPNSERVGRMRTWLWEFMAKWGKEWGVVQDAYWWNTSAMPRAAKGQLTPGVKPCVWMGGPDCYRDPLAIVRQTKTRKIERTISRPPSGWRGEAAPRSHDRGRMYDAAAKNGGSWPANLVSMGAKAGGDVAGNYGHAAGTPPNLARWWTRYICPPGGLVLDPFGGSGTMGLAAVAEGRRCLLIEKEAAYVEIARKRLAQGELPMMAAV
jgi:DNA modification methylase